MTYKKREDGLYVFKRDEEERARLNNQHRTLVNIIDHKIVHAPIEPPSITRIADVGTGTGIWLEALAAYLDPIPTANGQKRQYDGFDLSAVHFPTSPAENFHYNVHNILQPFPEQLRGKYDLVHVRLLVAALSGGDVNRAVGNLAQLLRPGGWIQWDELDGETWGSRIQSSHVREMYCLIKGYMDSRGMERHIPAAFLEVGNSHPRLQNVSAEPFNTVKYTAATKHELNWAFLWSYARASKMVLEGSGKANVEEEADRLTEGAKADIERDGIIWDTEFYVLLAEKK